MYSPFHIERVHHTRGRNGARSISGKHARYGLFFRGERVAWVYLSGERSAMSEDTVLPLKTARALCDRHNAEYEYNRALQPSRWSFALNANEEPRSIAGKYARKVGTRNARQKIRDFGAFCRATGRVGIMFVDGMRVTTIEDGKVIDL